VTINNLISPDPFSRISSSLKKILLKGDVFFDVHCHVFNYRDVPDTFLGIRIPQNVRILSFLEDILHRFNGKTDKDKYSRLAYFVNFFKTRTSTEITEKLLKYYPYKNIVLCPLMIDMAPGIKGRVIDDFQIQVEKIRALRADFPDNILPFIALDPNNPNMTENFYKVFKTKSEHKFFGVKIYPSLGYLPSHPLLMEIFKVCEEKRIPITAHCSGAIVSSSKKIIKNVQGLNETQDGSFSEYMASKNFRKKQEYADFFNHPNNWKSVLYKYPELKLNLAHFGGDDAWKDFSNGSKKNNWVETILRLMSQYKNVYSDFSYTFYNSDYSNSLKELLSEKPDIANRVLFGSDYYMIAIEGNFSELLENFTSIIGPEFMKKIAFENPRNFLFS